MGEHRHRVRLTIGATVLAVGLVGSSCSAEEDLVTVSGAVTEEPGSYLYDTLCATCHGISAGGGSGPALAGHTSEQVIRQVRAPVGDMPMFPPAKITESGVAALVEYVERLEESGGHGHDGHVHAADVHSQQDHSQILHALALGLLNDGELGLAAHITSETATLLTGNHQAAMVELAVAIDGGDSAEPAGTLQDMASVGPLTAGRDALSLLTELARDELMKSNLDAARHWVDHGFELDEEAMADIRTALIGNDPTTALELLGGGTESGGHHADDEVVEDDHHADDEVVEDDHHADDEVVDDDHHAEDEVVDDDHHADDETTADEAPVDDHHHDEDAEPHDH